MMGIQKKLFLAINPCDLSELYKNAPREKMQICGLLNQFLKQKRKVQNLLVFQGKFPSPLY